jgi:hypothetical protein
MARRALPRAGLTAAGGASGLDAFFLARDFLNFAGDQFNRLSPVNFNIE